MKYRKAQVFILSSLVMLSAAFVIQTALKAQTTSNAISREEARKLKNPVPFTKTSISQGRTLFTHHCTGCHGNDGKAMIDVIADATNLTEPKLWKSGTADGEIFRSIRDGAGLNMPPYKNQIRKEEETWHLVNFIRSLWPESQRPKLEEDKAEPANSKKSQ
jgi:mono/diheme cytochrome c family protein